MKGFGDVIDAAGGGAYAIARLDKHVSEDAQIVSGLSSIIRMVLVSRSISDTLEEHDCFETTIIRDVLCSEGANILVKIQNQCTMPALLRGRFPAEVGHPQPPQFIVIDRAVEGRVHRGQALDAQLVEGQKDGSEFRVVEAGELP